MDTLGLEWSTARRRTESGSDGLREEQVGPRLRLKFVSGAVLFFVLTFSVFYYQFSKAGHGGMTPSWAGLRLEYLLPLLLCLPFDTCASAVRIWLVCRVLKRSTGYWTCLKAEWANVGLAMLTPTQTGGGLGQIYVLSRTGISISAATIISLITFLGTMVALLSIGLCLALFSGKGLAPYVSLVIWPMTLVLALMALPLIWPGPFGTAVSKSLRAFSVARWHCRRMLFRSIRVSEADARLPRLERLGERASGLIYQYHADARKFVREGKSHFLLICMLSLVFFVARCFMAFFCLRLLGVENSTMGEILEVQLALLFVLYLAPTPGGSGIAELVSLSAMSSLIPPEFGACYNLLWRTSTLYAPAVLGFLVLFTSLLKDAGCLFRLRISPLFKPHRASERSKTGTDCVSPAHLRRLQSE